jgi:hypothetical protein
MVCTIYIFCLIEKLIDYLSFLYPVGSGRTLKEAVLTIQQILNENLESPTSYNFNNSNNVNGNIGNVVFKTPYNL